MRTPVETSWPALRQKVRRLFAGGAPRRAAFEIGRFMTRNPRTVGARATLDEALALMDEVASRHLPVEKGNRLVGVLSDRDIANARVGRGGAMRTVEEAMTPVPYTVDARADLGEVLQVMASNRLGCVVVKAPGEKIAGIFTTTDAVSLLAKAMG